MRQSESSWPSGWMDSTDVPSVPRPVCMYVCMYECVCVCVLRGWGGEGVCVYVCMRVCVRVGVSE